MFLLKTTALSLGLVFIFGAAQAATFTTRASTGGGTSGSPSCGSSPVNQEIGTNAASNSTYVGSDGGCSATSIAEAGGGFVSGYSDYTLSSPTSPGQTFSNSQFRTTTIDLDFADGYDETFVSALYPSGRVEVTFSGLFSGTSFANSSINNSIGTSSSARARVWFGSAFYDHSESVASSLGESNTNSFSNAINLTQTVDWGTALTVQLILDTGSGGRGNFSRGTGATAMDASSTLSFNPDGPAFILPEGFTVNAPELNIFNNRWIDPRAIVTPPSPSAVPLPASLPMLLAGSAMLGIVGRRRRKNRS